MKVSIIGTGYVGLVTGVCLSSRGHQVTCYDNNRKIIESLNQGIPTIYENGLEEKLNGCIRNNNCCCRYPF